MNPNTTKRQRFNIMLLLICMCFPAYVQAQDESDLVEFLKAGEDDASKLIGAYLNPMIEGMSYGFNGGWFHTAKAHKTLGFDIGVSVNAVFIPSSKNYFDPMSLGLETVTGFSSDAPNGLAPTIVGPDDQTSYTTELDGVSMDINGPEGLDFKDKFKVSGVAVPTATLGIGIYKNTDLKLRWMPEVESGNTKVKLFGLGVMHDIKQHIPGIKLLPFDLSVLVAYTNIKGRTGVSGVFEPGAGDQRPQVLDYNMNAWLIQALISKKLSVITFYGGVGYNAVKTDADLKGSYLIYEGNQDVVFTDPVSLAFKNKSFRATAGMRLKLAVFYLTADYTLQEYSTLSVGLGFSVR